MSKPVIILVDDEAIILLSMKKELQNRFGSAYSFEIAMGAAEADEIIEDLLEQGTTVALVICDWYMPVMNGNDFLIALHARRPQIPAIIVTGHADPAAIERTMKDANLVACLTKPWNRDALFAAVESCLTGA